MKIKLLYIALLSTAIICISACGSRKDRCPRVGMEKSELSNKV